MQGKACKSAAKRYAAKKTKARPATRITSAMADAPKLGRLKALPKDDWKAIATKKGCYWDYSGSTGRAKEFDKANREKDISKPPYPFDLTVCIKRCKVKGFRFVAVRSDNTGTWWKDENRFTTMRAGPAAGRSKQSYDGTTLVGPNGYPRWGGTDNSANDHRIPTSGPPIGPSTICVCGNSVGYHGKLEDKVCNTPCSAAKTTKAFGTNLSKGKWKIAGGGNTAKVVSKGRGAFNGKFDYGKFDDSCSLPCPKCWTANKSGNWGK
jgi:hypothetical protein